MKSVSRRHWLPYPTLLVVMLWLPACSGIKPYPNDLPKNLDVRATAKAESVMLKADASLHIYRVTGPCKTEYVGTMDLDEKSVLVGLPVGKPSYLSVEFNTSGRLGGYSSSTTQDMVLTPRAGHRYRLDASYVDSIYTVILTERAPGSGKGRELPLKPLSGC
jgi:hypothetical protein